MRRFLVFAIVGTAAQLVDGSLGMAYGVTSTTLLVGTGTAVALASAAVHLAEIGTTLASGAAHWRFGNVDWRAVVLMAVPGAVGAFLGAVVLSRIDAASAKPWVAMFLAALGVYVLWRFLGRSAPRRRTGRLSPRFLCTLGAAAGFLDAAGGGGWGPIGTPTLLASGRLEPRKVVGTVDASEFLVAVAAGAGFLTSIPASEVPWTIVAALLAGGLVAAPLAAYLVRALSPRKLGVLAGTAILLTNARTLTQELDIDAGLSSIAYLTILAGVTALAAFRLTQVRRLDAQTQ